MRRTLLIASFLLLAGGMHAAGGEEDDNPIVLDLSKGTRKADGSYELPSPIKMGPDGSLEFSNGKQLSRKEAMQELIKDGNARGPDGQRIDPSTVIINDDGSLARKDGTLISKSASQGSEDFSLTQRDRAAAGEDEEGDALTDNTQTAEAEQARTRPASAVGGIELISGGNSRDGVANIGEIPVLR